MTLETTNTVSCDVDIDKIIEDYGIDRFTKYYELQKIALKALHSNWTLTSDSIENLAIQLVSQLAIRLKTMKDAPITVKDLQYAIDNKKFIDFGRSSYEVVRAEIDDTSLIEDQVIINTKFILNKVDQKTVADIEQACNAPYFETCAIDYSAPYAYMASLAEVNKAEDIASIENYSQAECSVSKVQKKKVSGKSAKQTKAIKPESHVIPEEKDDYDPFANIIKK